MICTGFLNDAMPLVRYEVRDMAELPASPENCGCGRGLPLVEKIQGRFDDVILSKDGKRVALLDIVFRPPMHLREAQIIQETLGRIRVKAVPAEGWCQRDERQIAVALRQRLGDVEVVVETVPEIERTWAGKFRMLVSHVAAGPSQ